MRALHVVSGLDRADGGPFHTLPRLWNALAQDGVDLRAYTTHWGRTSEVFNRFATIRVSRTIPWICYSSRLQRLLLNELKNSNLVHTHGCWLYPNWIAGRVARKTDKPLVISPLGHLDPWSLKHHARRKQWIRRWIEDGNWRHCSAWIAKSEAEADAIRTLDLPGKIYVIPNGIHSSEWKVGASPELFLKQHEFLRGRRICLFLSRLHPKKGAHELLKAWNRIHRRHREWALVIGGRVDSRYARDLRSQAADSELEGSIVFVGELRGSMKKAAFAAASLFVLPSLSENFGQVVLESLAAGVPAMVTHACPWQGLESHNCGWWIRGGEASLRLALDEILRESDETLKSRGLRGREWVTRDFEWGTVAKQIKSVYSKLT